MSMVTLHRILAGGLVGLAAVAGGGAESSARAEYRGSDAAVGFHLSDAQGVFVVRSIPASPGEPRNPHMPLQPAVIVPADDIQPAEPVGRVPRTAPCGACGTKPPEKRQRHPRPGDVDRSDCPPLRYRMDPCQRAGQPHAVAPWAAPSISKYYEACWVGGGLAFGGRRRGSQEGTWGLDYSGWLPRKIWLAWGAPRQGGEAGYETDHVPLAEKFSR